MPDQPADPVHYEMKIPPEPKHKDDEQHSGSSEGARESNDSEKDKPASKQDDTRP